MQLFMDWKVAANHCKQGCSAWRGWTAATQHGARPEHWDEQHAWAALHPTAGLHCKPYHTKFLRYFTLALHWFQWVGCHSGCVRLGKKQRVILSFYEAQKASSAGSWIWLKTELPTKRKELSGLASHLRRGNTLLAWRGISLRGSPCAHWLMAISDLGLEEGLVQPRLRPWDCPMLPAGPLLPRAAARWEGSQVFPFPRLFLGCLLCWWKGRQEEEFTASSIQTY